MIHTHEAPYCGETVIHTHKAPHCGETLIYTHEAPPVGEKVIYTHEAPWGGGIAPSRGEIVINGSIWWRNGNLSPRKRQQQI